jgi:hypothetical protein
MFLDVTYKLPELLSVAGATIGIVIAGAILLQGFYTRYKDLFDHYRSLTGEYRANAMSDLRRGSLKRQIASYRRCLTLLNSASVLLTLALLCFLFTVAVAGAGIVFPTIEGLRIIGTVGLFAGLLLIAVAVCISLPVIIVSRRAADQEVMDFNDLPSPEEAWKME